MQLGIRRRWYSGVLASSDLRENVADCCHYSHPIGTLGHFVGCVLLIIGFDLAYTGMFVTASLLINPRNMHRTVAVVCWFDWEGKEGGGIEEEGDLTRR